MDRFLRALVFVGAALSLAGGCSSGEGVARVARPTNLVLIVIDTLRVDHLGCYGYARNTSPRIDAFAANATRYGRAISTAPWTVPAHASLMTGMYPFEHGAFTFKSVGPGDIQTDNVYPLAQEHTTLAELLRQAGYKTGAFVANAGYLDRRYQLDQGFDTYEAQRVPAVDVNTNARKWLKRSAGGPFFLFLNYMDAHRPYNTTPRPGLLARPAIQDDGELLDRLAATVLPGDSSPPSELVAQVIDQYDTGIANADQAVGGILDTLQQLGVAENTLVVVTSDHGEYFGEHGLVEHSKDVYQSALHVPLIIRTPGQRVGETIDRPISLAAVPNLLLDKLVARELRPNGQRRLDGHIGDYPIIAENHYTRAKDLYDPRWRRRFDRTRTTIIDWPLKYIASSDGDDELYNLDSDPGELINLISSEPETASELAHRLAQLTKSATAKPPSGDTPPGEGVELDENLRAQLQSLGYVSAPSEPSTK
ncbi:MAG: sulfatase [Phycisphaerales bacterium]|nr:sulfatase [Phycisphaerales bacterium]